MSLTGHPYSWYETRPQVLEHRPPPQGAQKFMAASTVGGVESTIEVYDALVPPARR